jgi:hypothetical protein
MIVRFLKISLLSLVVFVAGCGGGEVVLDDSKLEIENSLKTIISDYKSSNSGLVNVDYDVEFTGLETPESKLNLDGNVKLQFKEVDEVTKNSNITINLLANLDSTDLAGLLEGEVRMIDKVAYFNLSKVPTGAGEGAASQLDGFVGKWFGFNVESGLGGNVLLGSLVKNNTFDEQSEKALKLKELYMNTVFYKSVKLVSSKGGVETYELIYDNAAILDYIVKSAVIQETPMSETEIADLKATLDTLNLATTLAVKDDALQTMVIDFDVVANQEKNSTAKGTVTMNFEQELDNALFEVPQGAVLLN